MGFCLWPNRLFPNSFSTKAYVLASIDPMCRRSRASVMHWSVSLACWPVSETGNACADCARRVRRTPGGWVCVLSRSRSFSTGRTGRFVRPRMAAAPRWY